MVGIFQMKDIIYLQCGQALLTFSLPLYQHWYHFNSNFLMSTVLSFQPDMHADNHGCEQQSRQLSADCVKHGITRQISCSFTYVLGFQSLELPSFFCYLDLKPCDLSKPEVSES